MCLRGSWYRGTEAGGFVELLAKRGYKAYFVGGCVRDDLLGRDIGDIDISTSAEPSRVLELGERMGSEPLCPVSNTARSWWFPNAAGSKLRASGEMFQPMDGAPR